CCPTLHVRRSIISCLRNATATSSLYTLSLHDALPIFVMPIINFLIIVFEPVTMVFNRVTDFITNKLSHGEKKPWTVSKDELISRSEEHTSELQSRFDLVWRLVLENTSRDRARCTGRAL